MGFRDKYEKALKQQEIIDNWSGDDPTALELELDECRSKLEQLKEIPKKRTRGIIFLLISAVLLVLEILCLTETLIVGYGGFSLIDLVIIGIPFFMGIKTLNTKSDLPSKEDLEKQEKKLLESLEDAKEDYPKFEAANNALSYTGQQWDLLTFQPTPKNVADMERDFEDLMIAIQCTQDTDLMVNNWFTLKELRHMNAIFADDQAIKDAYDAASARIRETESWTLQLVLCAMSALSLVLLNVYMGGNGDNTGTLKDLWSKGSKPPQNADEQTLLDVTNDAVEDIKRVVARQIRAQMGK